MKKDSKRYLVLVNGVVDPDINLGRPVTKEEAYDYVRKEYKGAFFPVQIVEIIEETRRESDRS